MAEDIHGYYDWQMNTLLLAYDAVAPMPRDNEEAMHARREQVEHELRDMALRVLPPEYHTNPELDIKSEHIIAFTKETLKRANAIVEN